MRSAALAVASSLALGLLVFACDDEGSSPVDTSFEAGPGFDSGGTGSADSAPPVEAAADAGLGVDAAAEAGDAGGPNGLFAHLDGTLVALDPATGAATDVGATGKTTMVLAWDGTAKVARAIVDIYTPLGVETGTPKLATIDLCTGTITEGPGITLNGTRIRRAEGLAQDPASGTFYIAYGINGTGAAQESLSSSIGTLDVTTGAVTALGNVATLQNDGDCLTFVGSNLHLLDVATATGGGALYSVDKANAQTTKVSDTGPLALRVAHDSSRGITFATYGSGAEPSASSRGLATINVATGARTPVGAAIDNATHAGRHFNAFVAAPRPACP